MNMPPELIENLGNTVKGSLRFAIVMGAVSLVADLIYWICFGILSLPRLDAELFLTIPILFLPLLMLFLFTPLNIINIIITCYQVYTFSKRNDNAKNYKPYILSFMLNSIPLISMVILDIVVGLGNLLTFYTEVF